MKEKKIFAKGLSFYKLFILFVIGCVVGTYYEQILTLIKHYIKDGSFVWEYRRGVIYGPFSPIYGAGTVLMIYILAKKKREWYQTFLYGSILGGAFEYAISFLQETFIGTVSWDYSSQLLNINGRTTVPIMIFWGVCSVLLVHFIYPWISNMIEKIPYDIGMMVSRVLLVFLILDMLISWSALIRQTLRRNHIKPFTVIGEFFDTYYPDEYLKKYFPNMVAVEK
ncbi:MAG: putative ABC transporter permease [Firmicutes bacterium]|nr:putative ABC transporter permease [Bacillota bacterium]